VSWLPGPRQYLISFTDAEDLSEISKECDFVIIATISESSHNTSFMCVENYCKLLTDSVWYTLYRPLHYGSKEENLLIELSLFNREY